MDVSFRANALTSVPNVVYDARYLVHADFSHNKITFHWRIQGGVLPVRPPTGSISFIFTYIFAEKCMRQRLAPPQWVGAPQWEILDPPLLFLEYGQKL